MNPLERHRLDTVHIVPPTPFTADGHQIVTGRLAKLVGNLSAAGVQVFLPAAGTGEFHSLSVDEVVRCVATTRQAAGDHAIVIAPIGFGVQHAVAIGQRALDAGANGLLLMPVIHPYVCDAGFRDYFLAISDQVGIPLLTYKRGPVPSDRLLLELGRSGKLAGVKYAVNDVDAFARLAAESRQPGETARGWGLYCGTAERWAPYFLLAGATGFTSGTGCVAPRTALAFHSALARRDFAQAEPLLARLRTLEDYRARDSDSFNIAALKYAVSLLGDDFGPCRPPQRRLTAEEQSAIRAIVERLVGAEREGGSSSHSPS